MGKMSKLIALVIFSCFGISYGAEYDIKTIITIMDAYEKQIDSIKLKYTSTYPLDEQGNLEFVKGTFAQKKSEGYVLLDERKQIGKTWDSDKDPIGIARSYNGKITRYLEHEKNAHGYHMAALYENHNPNLYETSENPYYRFYRVNHKTKLTDLLNDPNRMAKIQGEELVDGFKAIKIILKHKEDSRFNRYVWLLPEKNYLPIKYKIVRTTDGSDFWQINWGEFKEFAGGIWFPGKTELCFGDISEPTTLKVEEMDISPLTKEDFEFEFPEFTHVTDHTAGLLPTLMGKQAPEFRDVKGWVNSRPLKLSDLRGKVILLEFWGYWCGPCIAEMPKLIELHEEFSKDGLTIIAIHDDSLNSTQELSEKLKEISTERWGGKSIPFPIALDGGGETKIQGIDTRVRGATTAAYGITMWPTKLLINNDGKLVGQFHYNSEEDRKKLIEMLGVEKPAVRLTTTQ